MSGFTHIPHVAYTTVDMPICFIWISISELTRISLVWFKVVPFIFILFIYFGGVVGGGYTNIQQWIIKVLLV